MKRPTDIITWQMTQEQQWHLERVHGSIIGLADLTSNDEHSDINLILRLVVYDLNDIMDEIEEVDPEKQQVGIIQDTEHPLLAKVRDVINTGDKLHVDALDKLLDGYGCSPAKHPKEGGAA